MGHIDIVNQIVVGKNSVGKSVLIKRYTSEHQGEIYDPRTELNPPTIGIDVLKTKVTIDNKLVELRFWDTAGQERYQSLSHSYYQKADGVQLVYDVTDDNSFERAKHYYQQIQDNCGPDITVSLLANKCDLNDEREIDKTDGEILAHSWGMSYFETSSFTNQNVSNAINRTLQKVLEKQGKGYRLRNEDLVCEDRVRLVKGNNFVDDKFERIGDWFDDKMENCAC